MHEYWNNYDNRLLFQLYNIAIIILHALTSIDVLPSKNQALCEYCTHLNIADTLISLFQF